MGTTRRRRTGRMFRPVCSQPPDLLCNTVRSELLCYFFTLSSSSRALAAPTARRGRPTLRHSARPARSPPRPPVGADRSPPRPPVGVPWMQLCDSAHPDSSPPRPPVGAAPRSGTQLAPTARCPRCSSECHGCSSASPMIGSSKKQRCPVVAFSRVSRSK